MSDRELAKSLIDKIPESRMSYVISYLQDEAVPDEVPNATTIAAIEELESGGGERWTGSTEDLWKHILEEEDEQLC